MILDNSRIHHAKLLIPFKEAHMEITLMFLPPYAPNINRIEGLWKWLKHDAICNIFLKDVPAIKTVVLDFLAGIKYHRNVIMQRLCW